MKKPRGERKTNAVSQVNATLLASICAEIDVCNRAERARVHDYVVASMREADDKTVTNNDNVICARVSREDASFLTEWTADHGMSLSAIIRTVVQELIRKEQHNGTTTR